MICGSRSMGVYSQLQVTVGSESTPGKESRGVDALHWRAPTKYSYFVIKEAVITWTGTGKEYTIPWAYVADTAFAAQHPRYFGLEPLDGAAK